MLKKTLCRIAILVVWIFLGTTEVILASSTNDDNCCGQEASVQLTDGIAIYPGGITSNDLTALYVAGNLLPLNYPYDASSSIEMDSLVSDLSAMGYTAIYSVMGNAPFDESIQFRLTIIEEDITDITIVDGLFQSIEPSECCDNSSTDCCGQEASVQLTDGIAIYPGGITSNDLTALYVAGNLLPLNYPYDASSSIEMDSLVSDLSAMGYTAIYSVMGNAPFDESIQFRLTIIEEDITDITIVDGLFQGIELSECCNSETISNDYPPIKCMPVSLQKTGN